MKIARKIFALVLALSLCLCLVPFSAFAVETYDFWFAGEQVTSDNCNDLDTNHWSYDNATHTLTLKDYAPSTAPVDSQNVVVNYKISDAPLNIVLIGDNAISPDAALHATAISVECGTPATEKNSLHITGTGDLYINRCDIGISAYNVTIEDNRNAIGINISAYDTAIVVENNLHVSNAYCFPSGVNHGVYVAASTAEDNGIILEDSNFAVRGKTAIEYENTDAILKISNGSVLAYSYDDTSTVPAFPIKPDLSGCLGVPFVEVGDVGTSNEAINIVGCTDLTSDYHENPYVRIESYVYLIEIPFKKIVKGEDAPAQDFELEFDGDYSKYNLPGFDITEYDTSLISFDAKISTNGAGVYEGVIKLRVHDTISDELYSFGITIREKNTGVAGWTYSTEEYVLGQDLNTTFGISAYDPETVLNPEEVFIQGTLTQYDSIFDVATEFDEITFTNTYTKPADADTPAAKPAEKAKDNKIADTADTTNAALYVMLTACFGGAALTVTKANKKEEV